MVEITLRYLTLVNRTKVHVGNKASYDIVQKLHVHTNVQILHQITNGEGIIQCIYLTKLYSKQFGRGEGERIGINTELIEHSIIFALSISLPKWLE